MELNLFLCLLLLFKHTNGQFESGSFDDEDFECDMSKTSLNRYWTTNNLLKPEGCINRTNISIIHMDEGEVANQFWNIVRDAAKRVCIDYNIHCPEQIYGGVSIASVLPHIATDIAGSTNHGYSDIVGVSLNSGTYTGLNDLHSQNIITTTFMGKMYNNSNNPYDTSLHVTQDNYLSGYNACTKMINDFGVTNILVVVPLDESDHNIRRLACLDAMIDNGLSNDSYSFLIITRLDIEIDISLVANKLLNNTNINGIFATSIKAHDPAYYSLNRAINGDGSLSLYGLTKNRANLIKCLSQVDFSGVTIDGLRTNITKFASTQQPYIASAFSMLQLALYASTGNKILFEHTLLSGPHFIETVEDALLLECTADIVRFCHDEDATNPFTNCSCINTQNNNKKMYLFHYGGDINSEYYTYFKILENGALNAANDHNITLNIIVSDNIDTFENTIKSTINTININNNNNIHNGIISPLPNIQTYNLLRNNYVQNSNNMFIGIANGYEYYKSLNLEQGNFFGADDILSGYEMSRLLHKNYSSSNSLKSIVCVDNRNGLYSSINDRCLGVENYCSVNNLTYKLINKIDNNVFNNIVSPIGIVSPGHLTCYEIQQFVHNEKLINSSSIYIIGCFDSTSQYALNGLVNEHISIIIDNQPWLIGYLSVLSLFNKLFLTRHLASNLIETGPKIITVFDNNDIKLKKCENMNYGISFCPPEPLPSSEIDINYPTLSNFSGIFILILFIITLIIVICIFLAAYKHRKNKIIQKTQPLLLLFTIIGGIIMMSSGLIFFNNINSNNKLLNDYVCNIPLSVWCVGFTIFFISYSFRVWKYVRAIEAGLSLSRNVITTKGVLIRLFLFICIDLLLVIFASIFTPIKSKIHYELLSRDNNKLTDIITSECEFNNHSYFWFIVLIYKLILIIWVLMVAFRKQASNNKIKKLKFLQLTEGPGITIGVYIVIISFLLYIIIAMTLDSFDESIKWVLISLLSFISFITILSCIIMNKLIYIFKQNKLNLELHNGHIADSANSANSSTNDVTDISTSNNNELYFDQYLQRCEYLIDEATELIKASSFSQSAAKAIKPKVLDMQRTLIHKCISSTAVSSTASNTKLSLKLSSSTASNSNNSSKNIELTSQNKINNDVNNIDDAVDIIYSDK